MGLINKVIVCFVFFVLVFIAGCGNPISINSFRPIEDGSYSIGLDETEDVQTALIKNDSSLMEVALVEIEDVVVLKLSYTNYTKQPVSIFLNDFTIKDNKLFLQDRIPVDYLLSRYGSKYKDIASRDIPPPNKQVVVEGGTTASANKFGNIAYGSTRSNYSATERDEPISVLASGISKGVQSSQLKYIEKLADKYLKYSLPDEIVISPETAILGFVYFQKKTDNYPYHLRLSIGSQTFNFKFELDETNTTTKDKELKRYFEGH